jgi:hypothetical protein
VKHKKRGRPSKFTPETTGIILDALESGSFVDSACILAAIDEKTFYNWIKAGNEGKSDDFREFPVRKKSTGSR